MKRVIFLMAGIIFLTVLTVKTYAQERFSELQMKVLTERPQPTQVVRVLMYRESFSKISQPDSIDKSRRIIYRFSPQSVTVINLVDTISCSAEFIERSYEQYIINAYQWPGQASVWVRKTEDIKRNWLGFWVNNSFKIDSVNFIYHQNTKSVQAISKIQSGEKHHLNYWLTSAWLIVILLVIFFPRVIDTINKGFSKLATFNDFAKACLLIIVIVISCGIVVFSKSIIIVLVILIITWLVHLGKKKPEQSLPEETKKE